MKVIAVVLNWNRPSDTIACVRSLGECGYSDLEVVVVDNASTDGSPRRFTSELQGTSLLQCSTNGGYAAGNNVGIEFALQRGADFVLILNNDVLVAPGFLEPMVAEAQTDVNIGLVTCSARFQSDPTRSYPTGGRISRLRAAGVKLAKRQRSSRCDVEFISGCIFLARRAVFETVGLLDPTFFMYFEDVDFSRRVRSAFRMVYTPEGTVLHRSGGGDSWGSQTPSYLYYMARNRFLAFRKEPVAYRMYLVLLGWTVATTKSIAILMRAARGRKDSHPEDQLSALWSGLFEGIQSLAPSPNAR